MTDSNLEIEYKKRNSDIRTVDRWKKTVAEEEYGFLDMTTIFGSILLPI